MIEPTLPKRIKPDFVASLSKLGFIPQNKHDWQLGEFKVSLSENSQYASLNHPNFEHKKHFPTSESLEKYCMNALLESKLKGETFINFGRRILDELKHGDCGISMACARLERLFPTIEQPDHSRLLNMFIENMNFTSDSYVEQKTQVALSHWYSNLVAKPTELYNKLEFSIIHSQTGYLLNVTGTENAVAQLRDNIKSESVRVTKVNKPSAESSQSESTITFVLTGSEAELENVQKIILEHQAPITEFRGVKLSEGMVIDRNVVTAEGLNLGVCVRNLSDKQASWAERNLRLLKGSTPSDILINRNNEMDRIKLFGHRVVFTPEFGRVEQALVENGIDKELAWVNYDPKQYYSKSLSDLSLNAAQSPIMRMK